MDSSFSYTMCVAATSFFALLVTLFLMFYKNFRFRESNKTEDSTTLSLSPLPSPLPRNWIHNVFTSFHGADVRKSFLSHFLKECKIKGIDPFIDNKISRGEFIGPELKKAIHGSKIAVVLLSKNYASSSWCLDELVEIMKCNEDSSYTVMVIFYEVEPTDVKKQAGYFGEVFKETCKGKTDEVIRKWSQALAEVATITGYHSKNWDNEAKMIEKIVTDVSEKLNNSTPSMDFEGLVGMKTHMEKMRPLLSIDLDEVRMIGICGTPGIGKTTIARFLFDRHSKNFQLSVFMPNIKRTSIPASSDDYHVKLHWQQKFLFQILKEKDIEAQHLGIVKDRLKDKKVLVVLDDVDDLVQLEAMVKEPSWFGPWSRIIITTQDQKILKAHEIDHIYKVPLPPSNEALQMFCMYAFRQNSPKDGFRELSSEVTYLAGSLPLGLQVMGSHFKGLMSEQEWSMELPRVKASSLDKKIERILRFSYDALSDEDRDLFIHIACFFNNEYKNKVVGHLEKSFLNVIRGLDVLAGKSLISTDQERIGMHSLLVQLGKEIGCKQYDRESGKRQFLVDGKDICEVLTNHAVTRSVIGISSWDEFDFNIKKRAFEGVPNLQFLRLKGNIQIESWRRRLKYISPKLQLLDWPDSPMTCLRCITNTEFLVELNMRRSKLNKLWEGIKPLQNLKWIDLSFSERLKKLPNLSTATNLQRLDLTSCVSLVRLPSSIGNATNLQELDLGGCSSLVELPSSIGNATNLQKLYLYDCSLVELPSSFWNATNLRELDLSGCSRLVELTPSIGNATNLQKLNLSLCLSLVELPSSIGNATNLQELNLFFCSSLVELPSSIGNATNLQELNLFFCLSLVELPFSIGNATNLQELNLSSCSSLMELPSSIGNATNLEELDLSGCSNLMELPSSIINLHKLTELNLRGCSKLEVLPTNINLESLITLNLTACSSLKSFPEISTNIEFLYLIGTGIKEVPLSIRSWARLKKLEISYSKNLKESPHAFESITALHLANTEIEEIGPWVKDCSRLVMLDVSGCRKLVSLSQLPDSLMDIDADNCVSLERLDCSFRNPNINHLNFRNCFSLNQEARDLIIQTSTRKYSVLPGVEVPAYFTYRAYGSSLTVELNEKPLHTSTKFKACILLDNKEVDEKWLYVEYSITSKQKDLPVCKSYERILEKALTNHLYIFEFGAKEVTSSTELVFEFKAKELKRDLTHRTRKIKECGILQL